MAEGLDCHRGAPEEQALFFLQECFWNSDQLALAISIVILNILLRSWSLAKPVYEQIIFRSNSERWPRLSHHLSLRWSPSRSPSPLPSRSPSLLQSCHYPHLILPSIITITPITNIIIIIITITMTTITTTAPQNSSSRSTDAADCQYLQNGRQPLQ